MVTQKKMQLGQEDLVESKNMANAANNTDISLLATLGMSVVVVFGVLT